MTNSNESVSRIFREITGQKVLEPEVEVVEETVEPEVEETQEIEPVKIPSSAWLKADIVTWLGDNGATVDEAALTELTKTELLELVESLTD